MKKPVGRASVPAAIQVKWCVRRTLENFSRQFLMGLGLTRRHEKVVLAGGTAFPGCTGLTCYFGTGWKACATDLKNFSEQGFRGDGAEQWFVANLRGADWGNGVIFRKCS